MEAFKYLILLIIFIAIIVFGLSILFKGIIKKNNELKYQSIAFIGIPIIIILYNLFPNFLTQKPTEKELVGIYKIASADNEIPESEFDNYTLILNEDGTFEMTTTPGIYLCESGNYDLNYESEYNELTFQCGLNWKPKHLKRKIFGYEIEFYLDFESGKSICFAKK